MVRLSRVIIGTFIGIVAVVSGGELLARGALGLGTPPLYVAHPRIEYMMAPNQDVIRFGNRQSINQWGMRSGAIEKELDPSDPPRTLVIGDSVPNGGSLTDQEKLATSLLSGTDRLYLNISAGSWGPANMLAYIEEFGTFSADSTVIILNGEDATDRPTFAPLNPDTHPTKPPLSALWEGVERYLPRFLPGPSPSNVRDPAALGPPETDALRRLLAIVPSPCVVLHQDRRDLRAGSQNAGLQIVRDVALQVGVTVVDDGPFFDAREDYRDDIHPNDKGQVSLANAIRACSL